MKNELQQVLTNRMKEIINELQQNAPDGYSVRQAGIRWSIVHGGQWVLETTLQNNMNWKDIKEWIEVPL